MNDGIRLREVDLADAAALTALFHLPEVSLHLDPPPETIAEFSGWIALSRSRRAEGRAACYALVTGDDRVSGLFVALRFEMPDRAEIGFAIAPRPWGTGVFTKAIEKDGVRLLPVRWATAGRHGKTIAVSWTHAGTR